MNFDILYWIHYLFVFFLVFVQGHRREWVHQLLRRELGQSSLDHDWKSELHCAPDQHSDITRQGATQSSVKAFDLLRIGVFDCPVQDNWRQPL